MCSLELYNWYENRFPNDFKQLVQIKHYNISDISFLLSNIWYKLDNGEKLLMCAVYYDDINLAKQMLNEKLMFRINPFYGQNYLTQSSCKAHLTSMENFNALLNLNSNDNIDLMNTSNVFTESSSSSGEQISPNETCVPRSSSSSMNRRTTTSFSKEEEDSKKCWCKNHSYLTRSSLSSVSTTFLLDNKYEQLRNLRLTNTINSIGYTNNNNNNNSNQIEFDLNISSNQQNSSNDSSLNSIFLNSSSNGLYFNQPLCDIYMQTPFYFAIQLNKNRMCQLFIDNLKTVYLTTFNSRLVKKQQIQILQQHLQQEQQISQHNLINCFQNHRKNSVSSLCFSSTKSTKIYLNSMLNNDELVKLLVLAFSNRNFDIAILILSNVQNPKQILNFQNLSESFIYNEQFCLYLIKNKIVEPKVLLKESINRHATSTTYLIVAYFEKIFEKNQAKLFDIYKCVMSSSVLIGGLNVFKMLLTKLNKHLTDNNKSASVTSSSSCQSLFNEITVKNLLTRNYQHILEKLKLTSSVNSNQIDIDLTRKLAKSKGFNLELYFNKKKDVPCPATTKTTLTNQACSSDSSSCYKSSSLSYFNRLKLFKFLFTNKSINYSNQQSKSVESIEKEIQETWSDLERTTRNKLTNYDKIFAASEYNASTIDSFLENENLNDLTNRRMNDMSKRYCLGRYLVYAESEPFLVELLLKIFNDKYKITNEDLIQAAKSEISELTIYYLLEKLDFSTTNTSGLLEPTDDIYGNYLEILFCRMVRCEDPQKELRLRRLFFESVIFKNAKMTCSTNLLNLFVTNSPHVKKRLFNTYFPCLFYLSNSFLHFLTKLDNDRFKQLFNWYIRSNIFNDDQKQDSLSESSSATSTQTTSSSSLSTTTTPTSNLYLTNLTDNQIDLLIFEFYSCKSLNQKFNFNFELNLKELARNSFMKLYMKQKGANFHFVDAISDSARQFIFYFNEIKTLFP